MKRIILVFILAAAVMYGILHGNLWRNNFYWYGDALFIQSADTSWLYERYGCEFLCCTIKCY